MQYLSLKIFKNSQFVKTKIFTDDQISIGSSEGLSLQLPEISPWHLLIEKRHNVFCVLDLNSEMGTFVNGHKITEESLLQSGSIIKIGPYELQFFVGPPVGVQKAVPQTSPGGPPPGAPGQGASQPPTAGPPPSPSQPVPSPGAPGQPVAQSPSQTPLAPLIRGESGQQPVASSPTETSVSRQSPVKPTEQHSPSSSPKPPAGSPAGQRPVSPSEVPVQPTVSSHSPATVSQKGTASHPAGPSSSPLPDQPSDKDPQFQQKEQKPPFSQESSFSPGPTSTQDPTVSPDPTSPKAPKIPQDPSLPEEPSFLRKQESRKKDPVPGQSQLADPPSGQQSQPVAHPPQAPFVREESGQQDVASPKPAVPSSEIPSQLVEPSPVKPGVPFVEVPSQVTVPQQQAQQLADKKEVFTALNVTPLKKQKGFWNTFAPPSAIKNLDEEIKPSIGHLIEVTLAWKERILKTYHFSKSQDVHIGSDKKCEIYFPNMLNSPSYKLMSIAGGAKIYVSGSVKGTLFQGKNKETRTSHTLNKDQTVVLKPYEMVKLNFNSFLTIYVRLTNKPASPPVVGLLNLRLSETLALLFAFLLTGLLFFYGTLYAPAFLTKDVDFIEKDARVAQVVFEKIPPKPKKTVKYDLNKKQAVKTKSKPPKIKKKVKKIAKKKVAIKTPVKKQVKKLSTPKKGKQGKVAAVAPGKAKKQTKKVKVGSARPGGSLKTGKKGSSAKTKAPDPTKMGMLGVFGGGGQLNKLDPGASGPGGLTGIAEEYTGHGGTAEEYEGEGIGTKTKELSSGGKGSALVGISGIKTKGKGLGYAGTGKGGLGERGRLSMEFSTEDIDVSGEIDRAGILRVLQSNRSKFDRCYQMALNANASVQGKLPMKWRISPSGKGRSASALSSSIKSSSLKNCVANVLENLNFPAPPSGQIPEVRFSFNFTL